MVCISKEVHNQIIQANENDVFFIVASGSGERNNSIRGAAILQTKSPENIENEPITWNWNPHVISKSNSENQTNHIQNQTDNDERLLNSYGQKFNKLTGEFNLNKRKRNSNHNNDDNTTHTNDNGIGKIMVGKTKSSVWSQDGLQEMGDTNFWSRVLFTNNNNDQRRSSNDLLASSSNLASASGESTRNSHTDTAVIFNSIFSNPSDRHSASIDTDALNRNYNVNDASILQSTMAAASRDSTKSSFNSINSASARNFVQNRKNAPNPPDHQNNFNQLHETVEGGAESDRNTMSLRNDLNATNNTFLQALNDLRLDYNDLTGTNSASDQRDQNDAVQSTSTER